MSIRATDGARLWCRVLGDGEHTVVVPGAVLDQDLEPLVDVGRRIVFVDSRNRGRSSAVVEPTRLGFHREVDDLDAVYEAFDIERASLIGWSYVGGVVTRYTLLATRRGSTASCSSRRSHRPPMWRSRHCRSPALPTSLASTRSVRVATSGRSVRPGDAPTSVHNSSIRRWSNGSSRSACPHPNEWPDHVTRALAHVFVDLGLYDWRRELASFEVPTLVVEGDGPNEADAGVAWVTSAPNARLLRLAGALRHPWLEAPEAFFSAVGRFLGGDWPEGSRR